MSWQAYVDTNLVATGRISKAAIIGLTGGVWASTAGYTLSPDETTNIIKAFAAPDEVQAHGVRLAGQKYFAIRANERSIYLKKGSDGAVLVKTKQTILVAEYVTPTQAGEATTVVEGLADYFIGVGY